MKNMMIKNPRAYRFLVRNPKFEFNIESFNQKAELTITVIFDITNKAQVDYVTELYNNLQNNNMEDFGVLKFFKKK